MKQSVFTRIRCLSPMRHDVFMIAWIVNVTSSIGTQIHHVNEKLHMAYLTSSVWSMSLLDLGTSLPIMFLGFLAGVIADRVDRRKLLLATHVLMASCAAVLSGLTFFNITTPNILLTVALLIGIGSALSMPAYQAILPELVDDDSLITEGATLNSSGYNISRILGPVFGGFIFAKFGGKWAFLINAVSFLGVMIALARWKRLPSMNNTSKHEPFWIAVKSGWNYVCHNKSYRITMIWAIGYGWFGNIMFSVLPSLLIQHMKLKPSISTPLLGCVGGGALMATFFLPRLRHKFKTNNILIGFGFLASVSQGVIAYTCNVFILVVCIIIIGISWLVVMSTVNVSIHLSVPVSLKSRVFGMYYMIWGATMTFGTIFWGKVAALYGVRVAIGYSAIGMLLVLAILSRIRITALDSLSAQITNS